MAKLIPDPSLTSIHSIYKDSTNVISLRELVDGLTHSILQDGPTNDLFGPEVVPANPSLLLVKAAELPTSATSGLTSTDLFAPADPLSSWESKLRERLGTDGSMEYELIWKEVATPAGRSIYRLSRSTPRTYGSGSIGLPQTWATPTTRDWKDGGGTECEEQRAHRQIESRRVHGDVADADEGGRGWRSRDGDSECDGQTG